MSTTNEKPVRSSRVMPETMVAAGVACTALARSINALARAGHGDEAKALAKELVTIARSIGWLTREDRKRFAKPDGAEERERERQRLRDQFLGRP